MWMSLACSSTAFFDEVVDRAHDGRAAGQIAQAFDVILARLPESVRFGCAIWAVTGETVVQHDGEVVESGDLDLNGGAKHDLRRALCRKIGWIGNRQNGAVID